MKKLHTTIKAIAIKMRWALIRHNAQAADRYAGDFITTGNPFARIKA